MTDRSLPEVIDQMMAEIPQNEQTLCRDLRRIRHTFVRSNPAGQDLCWRVAERTLGVRLDDPPSAGWQRVVADIFKGSQPSGPPDDDPVAGKPPAAGV